ncbi:hypothetical protein KSP40_PGU004229 [Platanthera guangdongensis]|uniref:Uncharacterized protein n=1 Tax=Platanthera guangdongensis TaxID=2320717 RepID=A0ABR2LHA3_9ASPA
MNLWRRLLCFHPPALLEKRPQKLSLEQSPPPSGRTLRFHPPDRPATAKTNEALMFYSALPLPLLSTALSSFTGPRLRRPSPKLLEQSRSFMDAMKAPPWTCSTALRRTSSEHGSGGHRGGTKNWAIREASNFLNSSNQDFIRTGDGGFSQSTMCSLPSDGYDIF